jgi:hypothetical protein
MVDVATGIHIAIHEDTALVGVPGKGEYFVNLAGLSAGWVRHVDW